MEIEPRLARGLLVALLLAVACQREPLDEDQGPTIDPEVYALGVCSLRCWRQTQCGEPASAEPACADACIDDAIGALPDDPCWAQWMELRRCSIKAATCEMLAAVDIVEDNAACPPFANELASCREAAGL